MMDLETLREIWEFLIDQEQYALAHEVQAEIEVREISKRAILDAVEGKNG